jgi:ferric-dicitrate binding protein FerR (iron transport regulator)
MDDRNKNMDALMVRFLQGTCTEEEKAQFFSWLNDDKENEVSFFQMKEIFDSRKRIPVSDWQEIKERQHIAYKTKTFAAKWMRYAAIIVALLGFSFLFYLSQRRSSTELIVYVKQKIIYNTRGVYAVSLPDGSKVWLHGATTLTYPEQFSDSIRMVDLQGEAYFAVQADEAHPFVVQTPTAKIRATGTEFNITAYPNDHATITTLVKGIVNIQPNHLSASVNLKPGQQTVVSDYESKIYISDTIKTTVKKEDTPVVVQNINTNLFTDWKEGVYRFKNEPFQNIALRLEKMYGVDIHIEQEDLKKETFSGMFTTDYSLKEVFEIIRISTPISYTIKDKIIYVSNKSNNIEK